MDGRALSFKYARRRENVATCRLMAASRNEPSAWICAFQTIARTRGNINNEASREVRARPKSRRHIYIERAVCNTIVLYDERCRVLLGCQDSLPWKCGKSLEARVTSSYQNINRSVETDYETRKHVLRRGNFISNTATGQLS